MSYLLFVYHSYPIMKESVSLCSEVTFYNSILYFILAFIFCFVTAVVFGVYNFVAIKFLFMTYAFYCYKFPSWSL